jgi:hypothetical protein
VLLIIREVPELEIKADAFATLEARQKLEEAVVATESKMDANLIVVDPRSHVHSHVF